MHNIPFIPGGIDNLSRDYASVTRDDRLSRDKLSMPPGIKGILCIKFDLFKIKNTAFYNTDNTTRASREMIDYRATNYQCRQV